MSAPDQMTPEERATLAEQLGDAQPARNSLLMSFGKSVQDRREHDHTTQREDWYCLNLAAYMGERAAPVLRRLLDTETQVARLRDELAEEKSSRTTAEATPDFFQPGHTYARVGDVLTQFQCRHLDMHPTTGERVAWGWHTDDARQPEWVVKKLGQMNFPGWTDVTGGGA